MEKAKINLEELKKISGGSLPDGELPVHIHVCPRCGAPEEELELLFEEYVEHSGSDIIDSILTDKTHRHFHCSHCGFDFDRFGDFWRKH